MERDTRQGLKSFKSPIIKKATKLNGRENGDALRMCIDHLEVNKLVAKDRCLLTRIDTCAIDGMKS